MRDKNLSTAISVTLLSVGMHMHFMHVCVIDILYNMLIQTLGAVEKTHDM